MAISASKTPRWYVADLIVAVSVEGLRETIVNVNTVLISGAIALP
jgi:hypothetical protein